MYPHERSLVKQLSGMPFSLLGVNSDSSRESIQRIVKEKELPWRSFYDGMGGPIAASWNINAWPTVYVIDDKGVIRHKNIRGEELDRALESLLSEMGHPLEIGPHQPGAFSIGAILFLLGSLVLLLIVIRVRNSNKPGLIENQV